MAPYTSYWALDYNNSYSNRLLQFTQEKKAYQYVHARVTVC